MLKKKYQQDRDELFNLKVKPQTVKEMTEIVDDSFAYRIDQINEKFDNLKNHRAYLDYFRYKYEYYKEDYFADEKVIQAFRNDLKKQKKSKSTEKPRPALTKENMTDFIKRHIKLIHNNDGKDLKSLRILLNWLDDYHL